MGFPCGSVVKSVSANTREVGLIPGSGRSHGGGNSNPLQYSCIEISIDRGARRATVYRVAKSQTWLSPHTHLSSSTRKLIHKKKKKKKRKKTHSLPWLYRLSVFQWGPMWCLQPKVSSELTVSQESAHFLARLAHVLSCLTLQPYWHKDLIRISHSGKQILYYLSKESGKPHFLANLFVNNHVWCCIHDPSSKFASFSFIISANITFTCIIYQN